MIQSTASVVEDSGEAVARAGRGLVCALVCPIQAAPAERFLCQAEHCQDQNEIVRGVVLEDRTSGVEVEGVLEVGASLLGMATRSAALLQADSDHRLFFLSRLLADIAFVKLRLLQGLFSRPDCWSSWRNNDNSCISLVLNCTRD